MAKRNVFKRTAAVLIAAVLLFITLAPSAFAESYEDEYRFTNWAVEVTANSDRSYDVTETIDAWFDLPSHGITRDIPLYGAAEEFTIENVTVDGDNFDYDGFGNIRIGDADTEITGAHRYVIHYTLSHYADNEPDADYFYFNIIGTGVDTVIENWSARITLPAAASVEEYKVTGGSYGSNDDFDCESSLNGSVLTLESKTALAPYEGVTVNAKLNEGAFGDAVVWQPPIRINDLKVDVIINEYGEATVTETYAATINEACYFDKYSCLDNYQGGDESIKPMYVFEIHPDGREGFVSEDRNSNGISFEEGDVGKTLSFKFVYAYKTNIKTPPQYFQFILSENDKEASYENISVNIVAPFEIEEGFIDLGGAMANSGEDSTVNISGKRATVSVSGTLTEATERVLKIGFGDAAFVRRASAADTVLPVILGIVLFLVVLFAFVFFPERKIAPMVRFEPPAGMDPAEMGMLIDGKVSNDDVVSLIYYWASHGHLKISMSEDDDFTLYKLSVLDPLHKAYEHKMFKTLWETGENDVVTKEQLEDTFYTAVGETITDIDKLFSGQYRIQREGSGIIAFLAMLFAVGICVMASLFATSKYSFWGVGDVGVMMLVIVTGIWLSSLFGRIAWQRWKPLGGGTKASLVIAAVLSALTAFLFIRSFGGGSLSVSAAVLSVVFTIAACVAAPFLKKRTDYGMAALEA
ncbi:MAG: DUF2207 domain-containing protein, partial [Ruminococcaceae bacterium]|nr:DUF2207 domain-containing protein [Oscillospiraceae bacterium]